MSTIPARASRATPSHYPLQQTQEEDIPDSYYPQRMPSSAIRYTTTQGHQVIQQGNKRIVIHEEPPPRRKSHWPIFVIIGMVVMVLAWIGLQLLSTWWTNHQLDATYGYPRTYQIDDVVGHGDSTDHPTHFLFENLHGQVVIFELPGGNFQHARIYKGPTLFLDNADLIPVIGEFQDVNGDGKVDMVIHIQDQRIIYLNDGTQFKPQQ